MANVQVIQRHAHLAGAVKLEFVKGKEGKVAKAVLLAISNQHRGSGEDREEMATAILWTLWAKQAEHAAAYLGKGSHVNIVGRVRNNQYQGNDGVEVFALDFVVDEIDYLDSRGEGEARRARDGAVEPSAAQHPPVSGLRKARSERLPTNV
jgi:single-stranded DNA-binding protein